MSCRQLKLGLEKYKKAVSLELAAVVFNVPLEHCG
jgi:hypothetical protein